MFRKDIQDILQEAARPPQEWDDPSHRLFAHTAALKSYLWLRGIDSEFERDTTSGECRLCIDIDNEECLVLTLENKYALRIAHRRDGKKLMYSHEFFSDYVIQGYTMLRAVSDVFSRLPRRLQNAARKNNKAKPKQSELEEAIRRIEEIKEKHGFYGKLAPDIDVVRMRAKWDKTYQYNLLIQKINKCAVVSALTIAIIAIGVVFIHPFYYVVASDVANSV
ncbi:hypothetical protein FACS189443_2910 [Planctomycetales bacterium]|nr:hypothetical protein FACS189443_2910 [Planctomycetales bacterium]